MRVAGGELELTYCTNIHPAESWSEVAGVLHHLVVDVKRRVAPDQPFGVGLRLSARACAELGTGARLAALREDLACRGLYVFTLNGFPFGGFHSEGLKERVYRPDWREPERLAYTGSLAHVLAELLPEGGCGSISTVPGAFRARAEDDVTRAQIAEQIATAAADLVAIQRARGRTLVLALEPEPCCLLETSAEAVAFFERYLLAPERLARFGAAIGVDRAAAERALRLHVGVCLDACHASVEFERPLQAFRDLRAAGIAVPKIQVSAGLVLQSADAASLSRLREFADDVYLHQVVVNAQGTLTRFLDLGPALEAAAALPAGAEWRVHFHVPVFERELGPFTSTQAELRELLAAAEVREYCTQLEVETYTFDMLPARYRGASVTEAIARELGWTIDAIGAARSKRE